MEELKERNRKQYSKRIKLRRRKIKQKDWHRRIVRGRRHKKDEVIKRKIKKGIGY